MTEARIRAAIFDCDGVVRYWPIEAEQCVHAAGIPIAVVRAAAFAPELITRAITGEIDDPTWEREIVDALAMEYGDVVARAAVAAFRHRDAPRVDEEVLGLVARLRGGLVVGMLSNATTAFEASLDYLGLTEHFDPIFNTAKIGICKPDPRVFRYVAEALNVPTEACLFIDDSPSHVEGALSVGMDAILFLSAKTLEGELADRGLLLSANA